MVGRLLHGRRRRDFRDRLLRQRQDLEYARSQGRHLSSCRHILNRNPAHFELDEIITADGDIITNKSDILDISTDHFRDWHKAKPSATYGFHDPLCDKLRLLQDKEYFISQHIPTQIPTTLLTTIWNSLQHPHAAHFRHPTAEMQADILHLSTTPTYVEFVQGIKSSPTKSAPGPTGLTYNIMACLTDDILQELYIHLCNLYERDLGCPHWKHRILVQGTRKHHHQRHTTDHTH